MAKNPTKKAAGIVFDRNAFLEKLGVAVSKERAGQSHGAVGKHLRESVTDMRQAALASSDRGDRIARVLSQYIDDLIKALFKEAPTPVCRIAVCAVGGYGRQKLAPESDIDLLFLHDGVDEIAVRPLADFMLYPLWDSGLKIGHGVHTSKSAVQFVKEDMIGRTAYLDARFLCGSRALFDEFQNGYDKLRRRTKNEFVAAKLAEQAERQTLAGETRYLVEPDIKDGKGGLRDVQTIHWIYKYVFGGSIGENKAINKILDTAERRALAKAEQFLWSVRVHLHDIRGRADDRLTFDVQPEIADRLDYADRSNMTAAERLMKHYFVTTVEVGRLTRILCAKLEEERTKRLPHIPKFLPKALQKDEAAGRPNLRIRNGRLDFDNAAKARRQPRDFFRLFRAFSKNQKIDLHPDALALVSEQTPRVTTKIRQDPSVAQLFEGILVKSAEPERVLRLMTEVGLLGKYIPAFGAIVGRIDYGLYRRFTLDEHVLRTLGVLSKIRRGILAEDHPFATKIMKKTKRPQLYFISLILHEALWSVKDRSPERCEKLVQRVARRLGLQPDEAALAAWGVVNFSSMIKTAERRNLTDAKAIANFAENVGSRARLDLLLVLAVCHLKVVGVFSWDEVTRRQLTELYEATSAWLTKGEKALQLRLDDRAEAARLETKTRLAGWPDNEKENFLGRLTGAMLRSIDPDIIVRFAYLVRAAEKDKENAAVTVTPRDDDLEAIVYADDRPGLLADIAGAIAASGLSVRSVQALTTDDGKTLDIFAIQSAEGSPINGPDQVRRLHGYLLSAARETPKKVPNLKRRMGDRRQIFSVDPQVRIDMKASENATVIEAEGLDRPGLLYELAGALSKLSVTIVSAHIATYGERAVDAFYLRDRDNQKIIEPKLLKRIEKSVMAILSSGSSQ